MMNEVLREKQKTYAKSRIEEQNNVSIDECVFQNEDGEEINYLYFIKDPSHNTEEDVLAVTFYEELLEQFPKEQHRLILQMLSLGYKQREIMQYANCSQPQISRIKNKIEKAVSNL